MSIDWITVAAQIANFLVLVWLLKRFLYRPILDGIDAREDEIRARMHEAEAAQDKAKAAEQAFHDKVQALNLTQTEMTETIRQKAGEQRDAMLAAAQTQLSQDHDAWKAHQADLAQKYIAKLHHAGAGALLALTRKALTDLADETLEARIARHLALQIGPMADNLRKAAGAAVRAVAGGAVVTSQQALPEAVQADLTAELHKIFPALAVQFETAPSQAPGLVLRLGGAQLTWTTDSYIDGLEAEVAEQLATGAGSGVSSGVATA